MDLNEFVKSLTALLKEKPPQAEVIRQSRTLLSGLAVSADWFQESLSRLLLDQTWRTGQRHTIWPNEISLAWDTDPEFSVLAYIWEPDMVDVVHDHGSWGFWPAWSEPSTKSNIRVLTTEAGKDSPNFPPIPPSQ